MDFEENKGQENKAISNRLSNSFESEAKNDFCPMIDKEGTETEFYRSSSKNYMNESNDSQMIYAMKAIKIQKQEQMR